MEIIPRIIFARILVYATNNKRLLKKVYAWKRTSKLFAKRLDENFWNNFQKIFVKFFAKFFEPFPMLIGSERYESIDLSVLASLKQRGIRESIIQFMENTPIGFLLPSGFAESVPSPAVLRLGNLQNLNDPEILKLLQSSHQIKKIHFYITNPTINSPFIDAVSNLKSVQILTLWSFVVNETLSVELRKEAFAKLNKLSLNCLILISKNAPDYGNIFDDELFTMLEYNCVKCLHLEALNHYIERWLATGHLHNRAAITNLCIVNDQFGYYFGEFGNRIAPLYYTLADYRLLFPKLKNLCIGVMLHQFDDNRLDSMLLCYFMNSSFDITLRLTVRLFHRVEEIPSKRFDWVFNKLKQLYAEVIFTYEAKKEAKITIKSKNGKVSSEIIICYDEFDIETLDIKTRALSDHKRQKCVDLAHYGVHSIHCLCINN